MTSLSISQVYKTIIILETFGLYAKICIYNLQIDNFCNLSPQEMLLEWVSSSIDNRAPPLPQRAFIFIHLTLTCCGSCFVWQRVQDADKKEPCASTNLKGFTPATA